MRLSLSLAFFSLAAVSLLPVFGSPFLGAPVTSLDPPYRRAISTTVCATVDVKASIKERTCANAAGITVTVVGLTLPIGVTCRETGQTLSLTLAQG
jgi:hypothetical protein